MTENLQLQEALVELELVKWWDSKREAEDSLRPHWKLAAAIGSEAEYPAAWMTCKVRNIFLLFCLTRRRPLPQVIQATPISSLVVGANTALYRIDIDSREVTVATEFGTPFYEFVDARETSVTAIFETGLVSLGPDGHVAWRVDTDLVTDYAREGDTLRLHFSDDQPITIDLRSGYRIP